MKRYYLPYVLNKSEELSPGRLRKSWSEEFRSCILELVKQEAEALVSPAWVEVADGEESRASTIQLVKQLLERQKTKELATHETQVIPPKHLPPGSVFKGIRLLPLHNNLRESDIRDFVKKREISASTRSFRDFLRDRLWKNADIPPGQAWLGCVREFLASSEREGTDG